jgi:hypothetical protein
MEELTNEAYEHVFLSRWSHVEKKDKKRFLYDKFILKVHRCIQQEKGIVSINISCKHNFINVYLAK